MGGTPMNGGQTSSTTANRLAALLPNATLTILEGHDHGAPAAVVAPVVADYLQLNLP
jgi:hypothetical protein